VSYRFSNNYNTVLVAPIGDADTTIRVADPSGLPDTSAGNTFTLTLESADGLKLEIVLATAVSGDTITVTRAQENTLALSFAVNDNVTLRLTAEALNNFSQNGHGHTLADIADAGTMAAEDDAPIDGRVYARNDSAWVEVTSGGGTGDHTELTNRDAADQHPIGSVTGLQTALDGKVAKTGDSMTGDLIMDGGAAYVLTQYRGTPIPFDNAVNNTATQGAGIQFERDENTPLGGFVLTYPNAGDTTNVEFALGSLEAAVGVGIYGNYTRLLSETVSLGVPNAERGSRVVCSGFGANNEPLLGWEPPPAPEYQLSCQNATDFVIHSGSGTGAWVQVCTVTIGEDVSDKILKLYTSIYAENLSGQSGSLEFGIGVNASPTSGFVSFAVAGIESRVFSALEEVTASDLNVNDVVGFYVRATGSHPNFELDAMGTLSPAEFVFSAVGAGGGGTSQFIQLLDTPANYTGEAGKYLVVNGTEDGVAFTDSGGGGGIPDAPIDGSQYARKDGAWDSVTHAKLTDRSVADAHPLSAITGLQAALDGKSDTSHNHAGVYEPVISPKNSAFNKAFAGSGSATTVARSDHNHTGVYSPVGHGHVEANITDLDKYTQAEVDAAVGAKVSKTGDTMTGALNIQLRGFEQLVFKDTEPNQTFGTAWKDQADNFRIWQYASVLDGTAPRLVTDVAAVAGGGVTNRFIVRENEHDLRCGVSSARRVTMDGGDTEVAGAKISVVSAMPGTPESDVIYFVTG